jgi:hypothetical protein
VEFELAFRGQHPRGDDEVPLVDFFFEHKHSFFSYSEIVTLKKPNRL